MFKLLVALVFVLPAAAAAQTDLAITMTDAPDPVVLSMDLTYTILARNDGPGDATNVVIADTIPAGTTFQALMAPDGWQCTTPEAGTPGSVSCSKGVMAAAESATLSVVVKPSTAGMLTNTASIAAREPDSNPVNNFVTAETSVVPAPEPPGYRSFSILSFLL